MMVAVKLPLLITRMLKAVLKHDFNKAIVINEQITKILDTYKKGC